jgi:hypothetical protein
MGLPTPRMQAAAPEGALPAARHLSEEAASQAQQTGFATRNMAYVGLGGWGSPYLYAPGTLVTTGGIGYYDAIAAQPRY